MKHFFAEVKRRNHHSIDSDLPIRRSARAMQDGVHLAFFHFLQQFADFRCGRRNDFDAAPSRLR
jgi:hypothetical protein